GRDDRQDRPGGGSGGRGGGFPKNSMLADKLRAALGPAKQGGEADDRRSGRPANVASSEKPTEAGNQRGAAGGGTVPRSDRNDHAGHTTGDDGSSGQTGTKTEG